MIRFAIAALLLCIPLLSQQREPRLKSFDDRMTEWKAEHHIILNVTVQDASATSIAHLAQHDITLLDNGKPQPLQSFREMEGLHPLEPVHVILVLDTLNNSQRELGVQRKELELFLKASGDTLPYPTSLTVVTDAVTSVGDATRDATSLSAELTCR